MGVKVGLIGGSISTIVSKEPLLIPIGMVAGAWAGAIVGGVRQVVDVRIK